MAPLRILLVEDDELFRLGLRVRLQQEPEIDVVEAEEGETAIAQAIHQAIDVVILDIGLPGIGGIETCRQLKKCRPQLPILVLTSHNQPALIARLIEAGAQGYCLKGVAANTLILAVRSVVTGASWWDTTATQTIQMTFQATAIPSDATPLTQRELEILTLIAQGYTNSKIADSLYIVPGTVRVHVHSILQKLGASDRSQAAAIALEQHLISLPTGDSANV